MRLDSALSRIEYSSTFMEFDPLFTCYISSAVCLQLYMIVLDFIDLYIFTTNISHYNFHSILVSDRDHLSLPPEQTSVYLSVKFFKEILLSAFVGSVIKIPKLTENWCLYSNYLCNNTRHIFFLTLESVH